MAHGLAVYVEGQEIITEAHPFNPVYAVKFTTMSDKTITINIPPGVGNIIYTNSLDMSVPNESHSGDYRASAHNITIAGNQVTFEFKKNMQNNGNDVAYYTFYRERYA